MNSILKELRYQAEARYRLELYKKVEFPFLQSINVKHIFQPLEDLEYGNLGFLHLQFTVEDGKSYWKGTWYENAMEVFALSQQIQKKKEELIDENKIIDAHLQYMEKVYMKTEDFKGLLN